MRTLVWFLTALLWLIQMSIAGVWNAMNYLSGVLGGSASQERWQEFARRALSRIALR